MRFQWPRPRGPRRGVTLVEMLVTVALLVLMMTIIVQVFQAATGAVSGAQAYQELDGHLRRVDTLLRQDLSGATATMTPPNNPANHTGYFEYAENAFADLQGEDTDDTLRFTAKAPEGQYFTGRFWASPNTNSSPANAQNSANAAWNQPILTTSQFAEIIYFLRNGNLYRRVLLVAPEKQSSLATNNSPYAPDILGQRNAAKPLQTGASWIGMNDFSARPPVRTGAGGSIAAPVLNTLGDLSNRENRFPSPRFSDDYVINATGAASNYGDGVADDENYQDPMSKQYYGDGVHDYYPSLYPGLFNGKATPYQLVYEGQTSLTRIANYETLAFPYIYPGAYSRPEPYTGIYAGSALALGWIHSLDPAPSVAFASFMDQLQRLNHSPLDVGDSLPLGTSPVVAPVYSGAPGSNSTWWGFPTWKETMSPSWFDPMPSLQNNSANPTQSKFLHPLDPTATPSFAANNVLPPMTYAYRNKEQPYNDGAGGNPLSSIVDPAGSNTLSWTTWPVVWEDDLLMSGVRSFDVKAYDASFQGYVDLGWGDDVRVQQSYGGSVVPQFLDTTPANFVWPPLNGQTWSTLTSTFAHEGRIPPLYNDQRVDPQVQQLYPNWTYSAGTAVFNGFKYDGNVGDNQAGAIRLRRVWDSWSTAYTNAPATGTNKGAPIGPPYTPPVYPSYPPPYPAPLRGLQIQIRVSDPQNQRVKVLTIRQDFTDKL